jgi:hypothetical protein
VGTAGGHDVRFVVLDIIGDYFQSIRNLASGVVVESSSLRLGVIKVDKVKLPYIAETV